MPTEVVNGQSFGEAVCKHIGTTDPFDYKLPVGNQLSNVMVLDIDVLCPGLALGFLVIMMLVSLSPCRIQASIGSAILNSFRNRLIHTLSLAVCPNAIYSASVVEVDTVRCFLLHQETTAPLMKKQYPITDLRSSGSPA